MVDPSMLRRLNERTNGEWTEPLTNMTVMQPQWPPDSFSPRWTIYITFVLWETQDILLERRSPSKRFISW